jgi:signal transduction histidine kinase
MNKLTKATVIFLLSLQFPVLALSEIDSLKMELRKTTDSLTVADLCFSIYKKYTFDIKTDVDETLDYLFRALRIYETTAEFRKLADVHNALGGYYYNRGMMELTRENWEKSSGYYQKSGDSLGVAKSFNNLSLIILDTDELKKTYILKCIDLLNRIGDSTILGSAYNNLADYHRAQGEYDKAEEYLIHSINIAENIGKTSTQQAGYLDLGLLNKEQGLLNEAIFFIEKSLTFNAIRSTDPNVIEALESLTLLYSEVGHYSKAFHFQKQWMNAKDTLFDQNVNEKLLSLTTEYETEKKELTIEAQQSQIDLFATENQLKNQWILFGGLSLAGGFLIFYLWRSRQFAMNKEKLQHDFSRDIIRSVEKERKRLAGELHDSLGQTLLLLKNKLFLERKSTEDDSLLENAIDEVRGISHSLHPFQFEQQGLIKSLKNTIGKFQETSEIFYTEDLDELKKSIPKEKEIHLYRMIQESLNNVEKHSSATACQLSIQEDELSVQIILKDNGKGFEVKKSAGISDSLGMTMLKERAQIIDAHLTIDSVMGKGTNVLITVSTV